MENKPYIVYVKTNPDNYIISINSSEFLDDLTGWVKIDEGYGDKYHHAQGNYFPEYIITEGGAYRYKLIDGKAVECTEEEIQDQEKNINILENPPTQLDKIESKVAYLAMMTGYNEILEEE